MDDIAMQAAEDAADALATARRRLASRPPAKAAPVVEQGSQEPRTARPRRRNLVASRGRRHRPACRRAGHRITPPGWYVVRAGDSVWRIADLHYDDGSLYPLIMQANRRTGENMLIHPCQKIRIPRQKPARR
ncbi:MAG: LysM peptidoglycan-binding domain-containing protein [Hyphomicrobiaceae bacterium]